MLGQVHLRGIGFSGSLPRHIPILWQLSYDNTCDVLAFSLQGYCLGTSGRYRNKYFGGAVMDIRTLFLDVGGVILEPDPRFWERLRIEFGAPDNAEQMFYGEGGPWGACKTGLITYQDYVSHMADQLGIERAVLASLRTELEWLIIQPMVDWVRQMRAQRSIEVIAVSNADTTLEERLTQFQLMDLFDRVINSARVGVAKPDPAIYQLALSYTSSVPESCLFIDDRERNMAAAQSLGIQTLVFRGFPEFSEDVGKLLC